MENPKMCNILKTAGLGFCLVGWGHSVHFAKFPILRFSKLYPCLYSYAIATKLYCKYVCLREYRLKPFFWRSAKNSEFYGVTVA